MSEKDRQYQPMLPEFADIKREIPNVQSPISFNVLWALFYTSLAAGSIGVIKSEGSPETSMAAIISVPVSLAVAVGVEIVRGNKKKQVNFGDKIYS